MPRLSNPREEVRCILAAHPDDWQGILGLRGVNALTLKMVHSRYRQLMRILHPDKRGADGGAHLGGKEACDAAIIRVQEAHNMAEVSLTRPLPSLTTVSPPNMAHFRGGYPQSSSASPHAGAPQRSAPAPPPPPATSAARAVPAQAFASMGRAPAPTCRTSKASPVPKTAPVPRPVPMAPTQRNTPPMSTPREEVRRILVASAQDWREVLGFMENEPFNLEMVHSRYRQLMRILHPDKRGADAGAHLGGKEACDAAMIRVQEAHKKAQNILTRPSPSPPSCRASNASTTRQSEGPPPDWQATPTPLTEVLVCWKTWSPDGYPAWAGALEKGDTLSDIKEDQGWWTGVWSRREQICSIDTHWFPPTCFIMRVDHR